MTDVKPGTESESSRNSLTARLISAAVLFCVSVLPLNMYGLNRNGLSSHLTTRGDNDEGMRHLAARFNNRLLEVRKRLRTESVKRSISGNVMLYNPKAMFKARHIAAQPDCSEGWYVTGYYVPREDELPATAEKIYVEREGDLSFSQKFLSETRTEGWGITRFGWALGYYSGTWHRSDVGPLDAKGKVLKVGVIAVDRSVIPAGTEIQIPTLPAPWASKTLLAGDVGVGIVGQHIDVFTGTGSTAEQETFRITSENNRVCLSNSTVDNESTTPLR